jgi:hypothetical protein
MSSEMIPQRRSFDNAMHGAYDRGHGQSVANAADRPFHHKSEHIMTSALATLPREIQRLEQVANDLAQLTDMDELKKVRDQAEVLRAYHKKIDAAGRATNTAAKIRVRAERRMGEVLLTMNRMKQQNVKSQRASSKHTPHTLEDLGISGSDASRWQAIASLSQKEFDELIAAAEQDGRAVTSSELYTKSRERKKAAASRAKINALPERHKEEREIK